MASGGMRFAPGTHHAGLRPHTETFAADNMLSHGQTVQLDIDETDAVSTSLAPGEFSLHYCLLAHSSGPESHRLGSRGAVRSLCPRSPLRSGNAAGLGDDGARPRDRQPHSRVTSRARSRRGGDRAAHPTARTACRDPLHQILSVLGGRLRHPPSPAGVGPRRRAFPLRPPPAPSPGGTLCGPCPREPLPRTSPPTRDAPSGIALASRSTRR